MAKVSLKAWGQIVQAHPWDEKKNQPDYKQPKKPVESKKYPGLQAVEVKWSVEVFERPEPGGSVSFDLPIWNRIVENRGHWVTANAGYTDKTTEKEVPARMAELIKNGEGDILSVNQGDETTTYKIDPGEAEAIVIASKNRIFINEERAQKTQKN